ncbi:MAG: bacterioferritin [Osedax symbiont Rs1]|nr:MAG: bacterioferritin [Osedax symbiont Rs1]
MQGDKAVLNQLNKVLMFKLTSINQYFLHARMYKNWGLEELNEKSYKKSIKDMKQSDQLIERILFLQGLPNLQQLERLRIGENPAEMLDCDLQLQNDLMSLTRQSIALCEKQQDYVTRDLLEDVLEYEEDHVDWIEAQQYLIAETGIQNYLQSQMGD